MWRKTCLLAGVAVGLDFEFLWTMALFDNARSGLFVQSSWFSNAGAMRTMRRWRRDARWRDLLMRGANGDCGCGCARIPVLCVADSELDVGSARRQGERSAGNGQGRARTRRKRLWARAASCAEKAKRSVDRLDIFIPARTNLKSTSMAIPSFPFVLLPSRSSSARAHCSPPDTNICN